MKHEKHNGNYFTLYDSIQELPAERFFRFNLYAVIDAGIGSDFDDLIARNSELRQWIQKGRKTEAVQASINLENLLYFFLNNVSPESNCFVCLVKECNGEEVTDLSEEGCKRYLKKWSKKGLTIGKIKGFVNAAKKKFNFEVSQFFPEADGGGAKKIERVGLLKRRTIAVLKHIQGVADRADVERYDNILMDFIKPIVFGGSDGLEVSRINNFEDALVLIQKELGVAPEMTAHQFIKHSETVKQIIKNRKKRRNG